MSCPYLSVVIPVFNAAEFLGGQLEALARQEYAGPWEVIVADNGSTDGTQALVEHWKTRLPSLLLVDASSRRGANSARNAGALRAKGEVLLFCDADDLVAPGWLLAMAEASKGYDGWGGRLDEEALNTARQLAWRGRRLQTELVPGFLPHPYSANCGVRRTTFEFLSGFNEDYVGGGEDVEFFWRLQLQGFRLGFVPDAVVRYRHRGGLRTLAKQQYRYGKAAVWLYRDFHVHGLTRDPVTAVLKTWLWLAANGPRALMSVNFRGRWVQVAARRAGRLRASIEEGRMLL